MVKRKWTQKEVKYLKDNWEKRTSREIATVLGKNTQSCYDKAHKLGLRKRDGYGTPVKKNKEEVCRKNSKSPKWTVSEITFLKDNTGKLSSKEIGKILGKSAAAVNCKRQTIKKAKTLHPASDVAQKVQSNHFKTWTKEEEHELKRDFNNKSLKELADKFGRTEDAIKTRAYTLGLITYEDSYSKTKWTKKDVKYLKANINSKSYEEIGEYLGRSSAAVASKASSLKISRSPVRREQRRFPFKEIAVALSVIANIGFMSYIMFQLIR